MESKTEVIKGIPIELIQLDEKSGEICIGDECFSVKFNPKLNEVAIEFNPDSQTCSPVMRKVAKKFLRQVVENRPKMKFREKAHLED